MPARPSPNHKRAIFFPNGEEDPRMIWAKCRILNHENGISRTVVDPHPFFEDNRPFNPRRIGRMRIEHNSFRNRKLGAGFASWAEQCEGYCICLIYRDAPGKWREGKNKSISATVGSSNSTPHEYCGPVIVLQGLPGELYGDVTLADFRNFIDYLVAYRTTKVFESDQGRISQNPTATRGVKIGCIGEENAFVSVDVPRAMQPALGEGSISPISSRLGMTLILWKCYDLESWINAPSARGGGLLAISNPDAAYLMIDINHMTWDFGMAPFYWQKNIGNVLVLRADGKDLSSDDVAMMSHFAQHKVSPMIYETIEVLESLDEKVEERKEVVDFITWENMVKYWEETRVD